MPELPNLRYMNTPLAAATRSAAICARTLKDADVDILLGYVFSDGERPRRISLEIS